MGILLDGEPMPWKEIIPHIEYIKKHAIIQFINHYKLVKDRQDDIFRWGDEIEYAIIKFDEKSKKARVALRGAEVLAQLQGHEELNDMMGKDNSTIWSPESCGFMIEGSPGHPYGGILACFNMVETNMIKRRKQVQNQLKDDEALMSISFPSLGAPDFTYPPTKPNPTGLECIGKSLFFPDEAIHSGHSRYMFFLKNINGRRGEKVAINVPIFKDVNTPKPFVEKFSHPDFAKASKVDHIYMDHMGLGTGCCCLQVTFQAVNEEEARWLYDQLTSITPVIMALSASTPIFRSYLADVDSRWNVLDESCDDRTFEERGLEPLKNNKFIIKKSRYNTTDCYLHESSASYNDVPIQYEETHFQQLLNGGIDEHLAKHIAHLVIRDPLQVFGERIEQDDLVSTEHFESIQSSVWSNMRFKPPPVEDSKIGWRVEFRPCEIQLTDFENAAYCCFLVLLTRVIISYNLVFVTDISKVHENMQRAQKRDAVLKEKFHFRNKLTKCQMNSEGKISWDDDKILCDTEEMSLNEIINGNEKDFPGLVPLIFRYLDESESDIETRDTITKYLTFIQKRASGEIWTLAHWERNFVQKHPKYKKDSHVPDEIIFDMLKMMNEISEGEEYCPKLLGNFKSKTERTLPAAVCRAEAAIVAAHEKKHSIN